MKTEDVKKLQSLEVDLAELIVDTHPKGKAEWDAFDKMVAAHKQLRGIDTDSLLQLELPEPVKETPLPQPRNDCPRCHGEGEYIDINDSKRSSRTCTCKYIEPIAWDHVKKSWAEQLKLAEV